MRPTRYDDRMKVFLSHALKDVELARQLAKRLQRAGFTVWMPEQQIEPGENWSWCYIDELAMELPP